MSQLPLQPQFAPWSVERAQAWADRHAWLVGCNYAPAYATNALEFWQAETFDAEAIAAELDLAQQIGFNSLRVYLHDLLWEDRDGLLARMETFLALADQRGIGMLPVFFDSCWHPFPHLGPQRPPERGVHNSGWVQSPGVAVLRNPAEFAKRKSYVQGIIAHFRDDSRIHGWDLWNEPENPNTNSYGNRDLGEKKAEIVLPYLVQTFDWAREAGATQPVTAGVWMGEWTAGQTSPVNTLLLTYSDVISFHCYLDREATRRRVASLHPYGRPLLCTEYMARGAGSTFEAILPLLKAEGVGAYNWGFVQGRTQTHLPWDSWQNPYHQGEPPLWFHEIFRADHTPYRAEEVTLIHALTHETE